MHKIEWLGEKGLTINPIIGCSKISEGCQNCYAERMAKRLAGNPNTPQYKDVAGWDGEVKFIPSALKRIPGKGKRVFIGSMGDCFHAEVNWGWLAGIVEYIQLNPQHTFLMLTKRPADMEFFFRTYYVDGILRKHNGCCGGIDKCPFPNLWVGVTCENQRTADERIPLLLQIPAARRFVSVEPMLETVDLESPHDFICQCAACKEITKQLDWVICGAETGANKRLMKTEWALDLKDQCKEAGVPFFFKKDSEGNHELNGKIYEEV